MKRRSRILRLADAACAGVLLLTLSAVSRGESPLLPHAEQLAPGVHVAGFADRHQSANCGWVALGDHTLLVGLPRGVDVAKFLAEVVRTTGQPAHKLVLTGVQPGDARLVKSLLDRGVTRVLTSPAIRDRLLTDPDNVPPEAVQSLTTRAALGDTQTPIDFLPLDGAVGQAAAVVYLPKAKVLFAGPFVVHGPRAFVGSRYSELAGDTAATGTTRSGQGRPRSWVVGRPGVAGASATISR